MSQGFNLRFDKMRENNPASPETAHPEIPLSDKYDTPGYTRNVCFVWPNGKREFFNYAYLVSAKFNPGEDKNEITLLFSGYTVTLHGYALESLFRDFLDHIPRIVTAKDARYALRANSASATIIEITVQKSSD